MNKIKTIVVLMFALVSSVSYADNKQESYNLIVKFKNSNPYENMLNSSELTNFGESVDKGYRASSVLSNLEEIELNLNTKITHVRTLALYSDLIKIEPQESRTSEQVIIELMNTGVFKYVQVQVKYKAMDLDLNYFNDPIYYEQLWFDEYSTNVPYASNLEYVRKNEVNNLGRKLRVAVLDSGSSIHEDVLYASGYDFITDEGLNPDDTPKIKSRDSNPRDLVIFNDGSKCSNGHGSGVASIIAAVSDNGKGIVGGISSEFVDIIPLRVLGCDGVGSTIDILEAALWSAGESIDGIPDIETPVDIINLSLAGESDIGCPDYEQEVFDRLRELNVTVVVAGGNESVDASNIVPASCSKVIAVGAVDETGDKADYSNFGKNIDVVAYGRSVVAGADFESYFISDGTSNATPSVVSVLGNLKLRYPDLDSLQMESIIKSSARPLDLERCNSSSCGGGLVDAKDAFMAVDSIFNTSEYSIRHRYQGYDSSAQTAWLVAMNSYVDSCNLLKYTWGNIGTSLNGISYRIFEINDTLEQTEISEGIYPQLLSEIRNGKEIGFQVCMNGSCGETQIMTEKSIIYPKNCI